MINTELLLNSVDWAIRTQPITINRQQKISTSEMQYNYSSMDRKSFTDFHRRYRTNLTFSPMVRTFVLNAVLTALIITTEDL